MTMRGPGGAWRPGSWRFRPQSAAPGDGPATGGPRIKTRPSGWPVLRTPKWMLAAGVVLVAGLTLAAIPHRPSTASAGRRPTRDGSRPERRHRFVRGRRQRFDHRAAGHPVRRESRRQDRGSDRQHGRGELLAGQQHADGQPRSRVPRRRDRWLPSTSRRRPTSLSPGDSPWHNGSRSMSPPWSPPRRPPPSSARPRSCAMISRRSTRSGP